MVKWCGKSAPRSWRQFRQGKPHRLKDQAAGARPGHYRRVGRLSRLVTVGPDKWLSKTKLGLQTRSFDFHALWSYNKICAVRDKYCVLSLAQRRTQYARRNEPRNRNHLTKSSPTYHPSRPVRQSRLSRASHKTQDASSPLLYRHR